MTLASPGVAADSNGLFHGLGDHASNSFSVDGQPITDQQSKVFSNQLPSNSVQSLEVISGAPPAEYGGKTSLVIVATTRSGQGITTPTGSVYASYGTFGSATGGFDLSYGKKNWGNFLEVDGLNSGRFLDPPEFSVFHDKGNEQNIFDRVDYTFTPVDSVHLDLNYSRSWFQTPNTYDNLNIQNVISGGSSPNPVFGNVGNTDQKSKIETFNIAPTYTRVIGANAVFNLGAYARKDFYNYFPSGDPLADKGPPNLQNQTVGQYRSLFNTGVRSDYSYVKGINNIKAGAVYEQTFLRENDNLSVVSPTFNSPCVDANGNSLPGFSDPSQCAAYGDSANPAYNPVLAPYDLTRGGGNYNFFGHTDVKELALYIEDQIKAKNWLFNLGIRGDLYNGLAVQRQAEPRVGVAYNVTKTNTVLRISYARTLETPFNENLVLSSQGCANDVLSPLLLCTPGVVRNAAAGISQRIPRWIPAGLWQIRGGRRRVHLEIHAQCLRLQRARQHSHYLSYRLAQLEDSRLRAQCQRSQLPQRLRVRCHVFGLRAFLPAPGGGSRCNCPVRAAIPSASTTTSDSIRRLTFSTPSPAAGSPMPCGAASTGGMTAGWLPVQCPVTDWRRPIRIRRATGSRQRFRRDTGGRSEQSDGRPGIPGRVDLQWGEGDADNAAADSLPGIGIQLKPGEDSGSGHRRQRQEPTADPATESFRRFNW